MTEKPKKPQKAKKPEQMVVDYSLFTPQKVMTLDLAIYLANLANGDNFLPVFPAEKFEDVLKSEQAALKLALAPATSIVPAKETPVPPKVVRATDLPIPASRDPAISSIIKP